MLSVFQLSYALILLSFAPILAYSNVTSIKMDLIWNLLSFMHILLTLDTTYVYIYICIKTFICLFLSQHTYGLYCL